MKINPTNKLRRQGFTLIEMIGVLAVIAILAAVLIPKVFEAINNARINNAAMTCGTVKAAVADHYAKFGSLVVDGSVTPNAVLTPGTGNAVVYDSVLLGEGFLDKLFSVKIGKDTGAAPTNHVELMATVAGTVAPTVNNTAYDLANGGTNNAVGSAVVQAVIPGVTLGDAHDLSVRIDGDALSVPLTPGGDDIKGRVKYANTSPTTVYVYITHR